MQLDLFRRRPVEPEDVERDVRRQALVLDDGLPTGHLPSVDETSIEWQRFGLGPVCDIPRAARSYYEAEQRWGV